MKKWISNVIFVIYIVIAVFVTICLLSYNEFKVTEFGDNSLVLITDSNLEPEFKKGDLAIVNKKDVIVDGEKVFFYNIANREIQIKLGEVVKTQKVTDTETTFTLEGEHKISGEYVLGSAKTASVIPKVGTFLRILESKWGFLFLIVMPALIAFLYQIIVVISQINEQRKSKGKQTKGEE